MKGRSDAAKHRAEEATILAWQIAARSAEAMSGKLKNPEHYLSKARRKSQSPDDMLHILLNMRAAGAPMNVRKLN